LFSFDVSLPASNESGTDITTWRNRVPKHHVDPESAIITTEAFTADRDGSFIWEGIQFAEYIMGWGCDPDTMSMAGAEGVAERSGHPEGSLEYAIAYRNAYIPVGNAEGNEYLARLDADIEKLKTLRGAGKSRPERAWKALARRLALKLR
jgi:hypothetical protein